MKNFNNEPNYANYPPEIRKLLAIPGVNKEKALAWFNLGIDEPQTFNQALLLAEAVGYSPEQAKVVAAQWQMESAGGQNVGGAFNYFGIKSHNETVRNALIKRGINVSAADPTETSEYENGKRKSQQSSFMNFNNAFEAFAGHKAFLETNDRYKDALKASNAKDFAIGLEKAGYATLPNYGSLLYSDYIKPKEDNPTSGDTRPKNWKAPVSSGENAQIFEDATYEQVGNIAPTIVPITPLPRLDQLPPTFLDTTTVDNVGVRNLNLQQFPSLIPIAPKTSVGRLPTINPQANGGILYAQGGTMNFKSPAAYKAWLAYGHASGEFAKTPGNQNITINNKPHKVQHNMGGSLLMRYANGGQLTEFANGGSHEENPMGGIPLGMANDGRQNLVEQNETKDNVKDYIFSERNKIDKKLAKEFDLPKSYVGKSFAEASKLANRVNSKRDKDWDSITANAIRRDLDKLITAQETFKQREEAKDLEMMMQKHPDLMNSLMSQGTPQSINPTMDPSQMPIDPQAMDAMTSPSAMPASEVPMAYGGHMYEFGGNINKGNINNYQNLSKGLGIASQVASFIPGVGTALSMGLKAGQQLTNAAIDNAGNRMAEEQQDMLMAQQNPNVTASGIPVEQNAYTAPNMNMLGMPNPTGMPVNTGLPNMAAYGGKLFAMGDFLGDPPVTEPEPSNLQTVYDRLINGKYINANTGKPATFSELPFPQQSYWATVNGINIFKNPDTNTLQAQLSPDGGYDWATAGGKTGDSSKFQMYINDQGSAKYGAAGTEGLAAERGSVQGSGMKFTNVKIANPDTGETKLVYMPATGKDWQSGVTNPDTEILNLNPDYSIIAPTTEGTPGAYAYGGNLYASGGHRKLSYGNYTARIDTNLDDNTRTIDLRNSVGQDIANLAGLGYNIYQGLSPIDQVSANELYDVVPAQDFDFTQSINTAKDTGAAIHQYLKNSGANPSNFLANYKNTLAAIADIQQKEETVDKSAQWEADKINAAAKAAATWQALQTNWGMKTSKQEHIKAALDSIQRRKQTEQQNLVDLTAGILANPDAAKQNEMLIGQRNYLSNFGDFMKQLKEKRETKKNLKKNKTV